MLKMKTIDPGQESINWNVVPEFEKMVWDKLVQQFWVDTKLPLSNDIPSWRKMTPEEQEVIKEVFVSLTALDTLQSEMGADVLKLASSTQFEAAIFSQIGFMEALEGGTQLMTPSGWKNIEDVTYDDEIAQWDKGKVEFVHPIAISNHYSDEMYQISTRSGGGKQVVSGGHRVYLEEKDESGAWIGKVFEARELLNVNLASNKRRFRTVAGQFGDKETHLSSTDRLKIAIQADGSFKAGSSPRYTGEKTGAIPCHFSFEKDRKIERLIHLSNESGWEIRDLGLVGGGRRHLVLMVPMEHVGDRDKHFDAWWSLKGKSSTWCREFIEESGLWDGHNHSNKKDKFTGVTYYTIDKRNSDFYVAVATLAGNRSSTSVRVDNRSETFSDSYVTNVDFLRDSYSGSMRIEPVEGRQVYCIQVPSTFLITRNGRGTVVTGNCIHAKFYSSVFSTLLTSEEINNLFAWSDSNPNLTYKKDKIRDFYVRAAAVVGNDEDDVAAANAVAAKIASVVLESFLFYSGFYAPLYFSAHSKLTNTSDGIKLILRDEAVHGSYIGARFQANMEEWGFTPEQKEEVHSLFLDLVNDLYANEVEWTHKVYDKIGKSEDVIRFLRYNANRVAENLGYDPVFTDDITPSAEIIAALNIDSTNFDFFSGNGDSYAVIEMETMTDDEWGDIF